MRCGNFCASQLYLAGMSLFASQELLGHALDWRHGPVHPRHAGDLGGLAEALVSVGKMRFWGGDTVAAEQALQRAAASARQSGNHHAEQESRTWLAAALWDLPIPVDVAVGRAERLLEGASGDPWAEAAILRPLALTYG
jgi:hypothetical protein